MALRQLENGREEFEVKFHGQVLQQCLPELVQDLDVDLVLDYIGRKRIFHPVKIRDIRDLKIKSKMTRKLIQSLMESDEKSYHKFKECLEESRQPHLKNSLEDIERKIRAKGPICIDLTKDEDHDSCVALTCSQGADDTSVITISSFENVPAEKKSSVRIRKHPTLQLMSICRPDVKTIAHLSKGFLEWRICARLVSKNNIKRKRKLDGRHWKIIEYFSVNFIDNTREIRAVFFKNAVKKFYKYYRYLKPKQVYYVSGAHVTDANPKYHMRAEIELKINNKTKIKRFTGAVDFPKIGEYDFVQINELNNKIGELVDVIGVVNYIGKIETVDTVIKDRETKREVDMVDKSGMTVSLTFWGRHARIFSLRKNSVLALLGVKVTDWKGISLSRQSSTQVYIYPDVPEAHSLCEWYNSKGKKMTFTYVH